MTDPSLGSQAHEGKQAIVTGGTSGIGETMIRRLAAQGMTVVTVGRSNETCGMPPTGSARRSRLLNCTWSARTCP